ncbi:succinate dehydrogenase/fumarate reductase transmembrane subunit [Synechococcus sp. LTW-G]
MAMVRRVLLAGSGLMLMVFLVIHLIGVAIAPLAPLQFEHYASALHHSWWLPVVEGLLLLAAGLHVSLSLGKTLSNWRAGNHAQLQSRRSDRLGSWSARLQPLGGLTLLLFIAVHLKQLRLPRPAPGLELLHLSASLQPPITLTLYGLACLALGLHVVQGGESAQRSLGVLSPENAGFIRRTARAVGLILGLGFAGSAGWLALQG